MFSRIDWKTEESTEDCKKFQAIFFVSLLREDEREIYLMVQQVTVPAVTQCLANSGSTLTVNKIQHDYHDIKKTIHANHCFKKQLSNGLLVSAAALSAKPKPNKNKGFGEGGEAHNKNSTSTFLSCNTTGIKLDKAK